MADQDAPAARKPLACEISAYSEEKLDRYLEENGRVVSVQDPENISPEFVQRLRDILHRERVATTSRAVDLDQVAARLEALPADREQFKRSPSLSTTAPPTPLEEANREGLCREKQYYHELVNAGGRPPYPFHLLEDFYWHQDQYLEQEQYRDVVWFWRQLKSNKEVLTCFCGCLLFRWERFRKLQRLIRDRSIKSEFILIQAAHSENMEHFVNANGPIEGQWGFQEYAERMTRRLGKYGFTRPFQLDRDLDVQDKLTTWIEYLGYEYYFYDIAASFVKRFKPRHDDAWNKLAESKVLRPEETLEVIRDIKSAFRRAAERESAKKAVESAEAAVSSTEKAIILSQTHREILRKRLLADRSILSAAKERYETVRARNDAITDFSQKTRRYRCEKDDADRHSCLLRWIEQQIPSIELELSSLNSAEDEPGQRSDRRRSKRARPQEPSEAQHSQEHRRAERIGRSDSARETPATSSPSREILKRSIHRSIDDGRPLKRLKTGGRSDLPDYSTPNTSISSTSAPTLYPKTVLKSDGGEVSSDEPLQVLKPLRRSARIDARTALKLEGGKVSSDEPSQVLKPLRRSARIAEKRKKICNDSKPANTSAINGARTGPSKVAARGAKKSRVRRDGLRSAAKSQGVAKKRRSRACP